MVQHEKILPAEFIERSGTMRIIWNELKKILTWKIMLSLVIVSAVFYQLFIVFDFEYFPNGRPSRDAFKVAEDMLVKYGDTLNEKELEDFKKTYDERVADADAYLKSNPEMKAAGLGTYEEFKGAELEQNENQSQLHSQVMFEDGVDVFWELQARDWMNDWFDHPEHYGAYGRDLGNGQKLRVDELLESRAAYAIFPHEILENYENLSGNMTILVIISVMIVITPLYMADRRNRMTLLQYTTKTGRSLFYKKFFAAFIAVMAVITAQLAIFFTLYRGNDTAQFLDVKVSSVISHFVSWYDLTFLQYIILTVVSMYVIGIAVLLIVAVISSSVPNYMTNIGLQIPLAGVLIAVGIDYLIKHITSFHLPKALLPISLVTLLVICGAIFIIRARKERVANI
jgi:hypothetical protein